MGREMILGSYMLFSQAKKAYVFARLSKLNPCDPGNEDALAAIVFSAASAEAFLEELEKLAENRSETDAKNLLSEISSLRRRSGGNSTSTDIIIAASKATSDSPIQSPECKEFDLLRRLRNRVVHLEAGDDISAYVKKNQAIISEIQNCNLNILSDPRHFTESKSGDQWLFGFLLTISTVEAAEWACRTTAGVINLLVSKMRESPFKRLVQSYVDSHFTVEVPLETESLLRWFKSFEKLGFNLMAIDLKNLLERICQGELVISSSQPDNLEESRLQE
jgi:hypothetical protein